MSDIRLILCTFPNPESARQIGTLLIEKQLAACVNLIPAVESIYSWQDKIETSNEVLAIIKTQSSAYIDLKHTLSDVHPYDVPEIISINPTDVSDEYADWVNQVTRPLGT